MKQRKGLRSQKAESPQRLVLLAEEWTARGLTLPEGGTAAEACVASRGMDCRRAYIYKKKTMEGQRLMKNSKQFAVRMATALFMVLAMCTIAAHRIENLLLTEVRTITVPRAQIMEDGAMAAKVPLASIFTGRDGKPCVLLLRRRQGTWGEELYVEETPAEIYNEDYSSCYLKGNLEGMALAIYPSRPLSDDETVRCVEE